MQSQENYERYITSEPPDFRNWSPMPLFRPSSDLIKGSLGKFDRKCDQTSSSELDNPTVCENARTFSIRGKLTFLTNSLTRFSSYSPNDRDIETIFSPSPFSYPKVTCCDAFCFIFITRRKFVGMASTSEHILFSSIALRLNKVFTLTNNYIRLTSLQPLTNKHVVRKIPKKPIHCRAVWIPSPKLLRDIDRSRTRDCCRRRCVQRHPSRR